MVDEAPSVAFVLGSGRCGSSILHEVIARHPDVAFLSNVEDRFPLPAPLGRWNNDVYRLVPQRLTRKGRVRFAPSEGYRALAREVSGIVVAPHRDLLAEDASPWLAARFRRFFQDRARAQGRTVFVHKFTGWPRAGFVRRVFPEARFVNVIRDGRAVANSFLQVDWWRGWDGPDAWGWGPLPPDLRDAWEGSGRSWAVLAGCQWAMLMDAFDAARALVPEASWMDVRYEDFVADPRSTVGDVLSFLGLAWNERFERAFRGYGIDTGRRDAYREDLAISDLAHLERAIGPWLERYGYGSGHGSGHRPGRGAGGGASIGSTAESGRDRMRSHSAHRDVRRDGRRREGTP
jgi:hypothetical protein